MLKNFFKQLLLNKKTTNQNSITYKTFKTLNVFDDVWISKDNSIIPAWIFSIHKNTCVVIYTENEKVLDFKFKIPSLKTDDFTNQDNVILYLNKPNEE